MKMVFSKLDQIPRSIKIGAIVAASITSILGSCIFCGVVSVFIAPSITPSPTIEISQTRVPATETILPTITLLPSAFTASPIASAKPSTELTIIPAPITGISQQNNCIPSNIPEVGRVIEIVDGDTIRVLINGTVYPVRYIGMDTPESTIQHQLLGIEAGKKNSELVLNKKVNLYKDVSETDSFGRLLRYVVTEDDIFVNNELVITGYAEAKDYPPDISCSVMFQQSQVTAQQNRINLWTAFIPVPFVQGNAYPTQTPPTTNNLIDQISGSVIIVFVDKVNEFVIISNQGSSAINLTGWVLISERGPQSCALSGIIAAEENLKIWAMQSLDGTGFSCGFESEIWNNGKPDPAVLYDSSSNEVSRY